MPLIDRAGGSACVDQSFLWSLANGNPLETGVEDGATVANYFHVEDPDGNVSTMPQTVTHTTFDYVDATFWQFHARLARSSVSTSVFASAARGLAPPPLALIRLGPSAPSLHRTPCGLVLL